MSVLASRNLIGCHKILSPMLRSSTRAFCYKIMQRPTLPTDQAQNEYVDKKQNELSLAKQLQAKILAKGPITVGEYMREVLTNPAAGYYMSKDVFGSEGDFITSPEIGQIFGEVRALRFDVVRISTTF